MTDYALTLTDISDRRLGPVSIALLPGEIAGLVGPAGAGKTRLLRVTAGGPPAPRLRGRQPGISARAHCPGGADVLRAPALRGQ